MPPDTIRTLPFGTGLIMLRAAPPIIASLKMWTARSDAKALRANREEIEGLMRAPNRGVPESEPKKIRTDDPSRDRSAPAPSKADTVSGGDLMHPVEASDG
jgi:hypothetical protein